MGRVAVLKIVSGNFSEGFVVCLEIRQDNGPPVEEIPGNLPANSEIPDLYRDWQSNYRSLGRQFRNDFDFDEGLPTNHSKSEDIEVRRKLCRESAQLLEKHLQDWLKSKDDGWREIREGLLKQLVNKSDEFRVLIQAKDPQLWGLPWHVWDLLQAPEHRDVEIALAPPKWKQSRRLKDLSTSRDKIHILAVLGDSTGINAEPDCESIKALPNVDPVFLKEPEPQRLLNVLREKRGWDILFFAGHSKTEGEEGRIFINKTHSLTIGEFKHSLGEAIHQGLRLAIFNSCDGLGLAQNLADLQLPFVIVMRDLVPDHIAREFLREFLTEYANGQPLYTSVRRARKRLEAWKQEWPGVTWLPVIFQNPAEVPPTWQELLEIKDSNTRVQNPLKITQRLTWRDLQKIARAISKRRVAGIESKYKRDTYLQRNKAIETFRRFIQSEKVCFVLTGKSGVGKSNFIMSLLDEYPEDHPGVCLLVYNAQALSKTQKELTEIIVEDFNNHNHLRTQPDSVQTNSLDFYQIINHIEDIQNKKIILIIDAINESIDANRLFRNINDLVESSPWPWLQVVVTSRPETWRSIKRGVTLAEAYYYREQEQENLFFELKQFTYSQEIKPFEQDELPLVYEKYRKVGKLQSSYTSLSLEVKEIIRDPLMLSLITEIYENQAIPSLVKGSEIFEKYINKLLNEKRLREEDLHFLQTELITLMFKEKSYTNEITYEIISTAKLSKGESLFSSIYSDNQQKGQPMNRTFQNLANADIIELRGEGSQQALRFKYERFYEYFGSQYLTQLFNQSKEPASKYLELINHVPNSPWLWGTARTALVKVFNVGRYEIALELALTEIPLVKDLLVAALQEYANDTPDQATLLLKRLIKLRAKQDSHMWLWWKNRRSHRLKLINARRAAIEAAYKAGLVDILIDGLKDSSSSVRATAIQYVVRLWKEKDKKIFSKQIQGKSEHLSQLVFSILENLSGELFSIWKIPRFSILESMVGISCLVWFENHQDITILNQLKEVWKPIFYQFSQYIFLLKNLLIIRTSPVFATLLSHGKEVEHHLNDAELSRFFKLDKRTKTVFRNLLSYLDPEYGDLADVEADVLQLAQCRNIGTWYLLATLFLRHTERYPERTIPLLQKVFNLTSTVSPPPPAIALSRDVFRYALSKEQILLHPDWLDFLRESAWTFFDTHHNSFKTEIRSYNYTLIEVYQYNYYRCSGHLDLDFNNKVIQKLRITKSVNLHRAILLRDIPTTLGFQSVPSKLVIAFLKDILSEMRLNGLQDIKVESLAKIRSFAPEEIDNFLFETEVSQQLRNQIKNKNIQTLGTLITFRLTSFFVEFLILSPKQKRIDFIGNLFWLYYNSSSFNNWLSKSLNYLFEILKEELS
jgi:hypothetical protein